MSAGALQKRRLGGGALFAGLAALAACAAAVSCGGDAKSTNDPSRIDPPSADVPELEIRSNGVDRFTTCPPPGDLGQHWIPPAAPWTPPSAVDAGPPPPIDQDFIARTADRTPTELAIEATHRDFRSCYRRALVRHPTQDGRVAIVVRVGPSGRVAKVESYGACELAPEAIACMYGVAERLHFPPPPGGSDTLTIPATFTSRDGVRRTTPTANDAYTAAAYVALEAARPALHACEGSARTEGRPVHATGTFTMDIASDGRVTRAHVDPWAGDKTLLLCAARALEALRFNAPDGGKGTVIARLNFNPRQGGR
ncbi:MAG: AgmX/PglI C-terminal domain-containing protein [Labilithrix sp.]|nr:AgmX/PglI C-terminal domain-containing protein [Labilithrix sp.]